MNGIGGYGGGGSASAGTQTLQTMNALDMAQFGEGGATADNFYYGGAFAEKCTQTHLSAYGGASLFNTQQSGGSYNTWGQGAAMTSTTSRSWKHTSVYERTSDGDVYSAGGFGGIFGSQAAAVACMNRGCHRSLCLYSELPLMP